MTRSFESRAVETDLVDQLVDLASRSPSAGKTQGWHIVVLEGNDTSRFWDITMPAARRENFRFRHLLDAPVIALPLADPSAYVARYGESDKSTSGLGRGTSAWPVPYWTIDASMAVMTMLLGAEHLGLGALFFGVFRGEAELRSALAIPDGLVLVGAIALGWPRVDGAEPGRSSARQRRSPSEIIHRGGW
jgi:nitroreductase